MYDADSKGALNYLNLAREILQRNNFTNIQQTDKILDLNEQN
jgi:chromosome partitioning protein